MNNIKYLNNDICELTPLTEINYNIKKNIISTSLFKLHGGGYKDFSNYITGIKLLNDVAKKNGMEVRLFIDNSIYEDDEMMKKLKLMKRVSIILYKCNNFITDGHHVGLFGTFVRFFPLFDFPNNDAEFTIIMDADVTFGMLDRMIKFYEVLKKDGAIKKVYF